MAGDGEQGERKAGSLAPPATSYAEATVIHSTQPFLPHALYKT